jgi:ABC-type transport system involved in cytochrome bd biosynthesis fused ATPase/permease subunit
MIFDKTTYYVPESNNDNPVGYIALTPVDDADEKSNYFSALKFAIDSEQICNIALTGPFGSGKSSIIKTFEKNNQYKFLNISLASFKEGTEDQIQNNLIERSILQQMLYGSDASKLPYSRVCKEICVNGFLEFRSSA